MNINGKSNISTCGHKKNITAGASEALCCLTLMLSDLLPGQLFCRGKAVYQLLPGDRRGCGGQGGRRCGWVTEVILLEERKRDREILNDKKGIADS